MKDSGFHVGASSFMSYSPMPVRDTDRAVSRVSLEEAAGSRFTADERRVPTGLCLVTGASGFIGSHLIESLCESGYRLRVLVRKSSNLQWVRGLPVELAYGDIRDKASLAGACTGVENVFHFAALTSARTAEEFYAANHEGTRNLAEALAERGDGTGFFVYCSSLAAGGPAIATASRPFPVRTETDPDTPINPYGKSKLQGEQALKEIAKSSGKIRPAIIRPPVVYGPRDQGVLELFRWIKRGILPLGGPEGARLCLVHVHDLVRAAKAVAELDLAGTYYVTDDSAYTWNEFGRRAAEYMHSDLREVRIPPVVSRFVASVGEMVGAVTGKPPMLNRWKVQEMRQAHWVCSSEKAFMTWGYEPEVDLDSGLEETLSWYRESGWL